MTEAAGPSAFGRATEDGTVFVVTADGERMVGQVPDVTPEEALAFYVRRYDSLAVEVRLLSDRVARGALSPDEATRSIATLRTHVLEANAVGDLAALVNQLDALAPVVAEAQAAKKAERSRATADAKAAKEAMVTEAEVLSQGDDWRGGVNRFRDLLDRWKALPRIDRATDDALWRRFSTARTTYTRRRKAQFAEQAERRDHARHLKEAIIVEARQLATSDQWGPTAGGFRDLMDRWKAAGAAPRDVDDALWAEFRGIQDEFFARRSSALSEQDSEFKANLTAKQELLDEAEKTILPVTDVAVARAAFREFLAAYNAYGKVPREAIRTLENRVRTLESAVTDAAEAEWRRTDPETRTRAEETAALLSGQIAKLEVALAEAERKGDAKAASQARTSIATYSEWLEQANRTLEDFNR